MKSLVNNYNGDVENRSDQFSLFDSLHNLQGELTAGLSLYWETAAGILEGSGVKLIEPEPRYYSLEANFFTKIFMYSFYKAKILPSQDMLSLTGLRLS